LIEQSRIGNPKAKNELAKMFYAPLFTVARPRVGTENAKDVVQELMIGPFYEICNNHERGRSSFTSRLIQKTIWRCKHFLAKIRRRDNCKAKYKVEGPEGTIPPRRNGCQCAFEGPSSEALEAGSRLDSQLAIELAEQAIQKLGIPLAPILSGSPDLLIPPSPLNALEYDEERKKTRDRLRYVLRAKFQLEFEIAFRRATGTWNAEECDQLLRLFARYYHLQPSVCSSP
jgi:hypothetical protein